MRNIYDSMETNRISKCQNETVILFYGYLYFSQKYTHKKLLCGCILPFLFDIRTRCSIVSTKCYRGYSHEVIIGDFDAATKFGILNNLKYLREIEKKTAFLDLTTLERTRSIKITGKSEHVYIINYQ